MACSALFFTVSLTAAGYNAAGPSTAEMLTAVNDARFDSGLQPVKLNKRLSAAAEARAFDMINNGYFDHENLAGELPWRVIEGKNYSFLHAGENLAINYSDAKNVISAWLNSPAHETNLLNPLFSETGVSVVSVGSGNEQKTLIVELFAAPQPEPEE